MADLAIVRPAAGGVLLALRVHPRARRTGVKGTIGGALKVEVAAPADGGAANAAVIELVARLLRVARGDVRLVVGATSRSKVVEVSGVDVATARAKLGLTDA